MLHIISLSATVLDQKLTTYKNVGLLLKTTTLQKMGQNSIYPDDWFGKCPCTFVSALRKVQHLDLFAKRARGYFAAFIS